jgi:formate hydrogenlyase subunit 3/multisubunit Na+/H+ antiporter MnhD subunit
VPTVVALIGVALLIGTAILAIMVPRRQSGSAVVYFLSFAASIALLAAALAGVFGAGGGSADFVLPIGLPWIGARFTIDPLSAFFLTVVNLGAAAASFYGLGYGRHERAPQRVLPFFPAFVAGMNLVLLADDAFSFLLAWEFMSLSSWALVMAHHREGDNRRAGQVYIVMAGLGTLTLLLAFGLLAGPSGAYDFDSIRAAGVTPGIAALVLSLVLVGAGSKAGIVPLHVWLPLAHPAAPSHVSALMSGVMTKVAIYGIVRIVFDLIGTIDWWWAAIVLVLGGITTVLGVLYALMEHDLKRLLAYHTVENIGIITIGLGLALAFRANGMVAAAALSLAAALLHVFNHSLFKSLLFFGAGAVLGSTGERDMDRLGGLISRMPVTAVLFLVGCVAISALPPLNGFVSEWLTFQAVLLSPDLPQWVLKLLVPAVGALLALSAALAAACFVKAFGISFLGRPRSPVAESAHETDRYSLAAMAALALLCVLAGIVPVLFIDLVAPAVAGLVGAEPAMVGTAPWLSIVPIAEGRSSYNGLLVFVFIAVAGGVAAYAIHRFASRAVRRAPAWDCGFPEPSPATQYTAGSFAQPIRRVFGSFVFRARETVDMPAPGSLRAAAFHVSLRDLAWDAIFTPVANGVGRVADRLNRFQFLTVRRYLMIVFAALVVLLTSLAVWQ